MLLPRNICLGPQHTPRVQAEGSEMHLVMGDYPCASSLLPLWLVPNGTAGDPETKWTPFQEAEIRRLRNYGAIQTLSMLLRTWPDLALIKVNQPIRGRSERRSKWGWMLMQQGTKGLAGNRWESLFLQMREMLHCALPYVRCNLWPYGWRTFLTPKARCWTWSKLDGAKGRKEFAVFQRQRNVGKRCHWCWLFSILLVQRWRQRRFLKFSEINNYNIKGSIWKKTKHKNVDISKYLAFFTKLRRRL